MFGRDEFNIRRAVIIFCIGGFFMLFVTLSFQDQDINQLSVQSYAQPIFEKCYDDDDCTIDSMYELSQNNSTQSVLLTIDELIDLYVDADFYCHPIVHHLGEFLYGYLGRDLKQASDLSDYRCASGIMHGLVENTIQIENLLDGKSIESIDIKKPCNAIDNLLGDAAKKECVHGMGHSLIKIYNYNTTQALERCNEFDDWREVYMCNGGLFMQNMDEYTKTRGGDFNMSDLYYPCNQINGTANEEAAALCARYQANYFLSKTNYDFQRTYSLCSDFENEANIPICYKGVSAHLTKINFNDISKTKLMCDSTPENYKDQCISGAIESLTRFVSGEKGKEFCEMWDSDYENKCFTRMNSLIENRYEK